MGSRTLHATRTAIYLQNGTVLMEVSLCEAYNKGMAKPSIPK